MGVNVDDGGPAFPQPMTLDADKGKFEWPGNGWGIGGMSLRDWFAGQALQGLLASSGGGTLDPQRDAAWSYTQADALLLARKAQP